jgi:DUF1680 family protein
MCELTGDAKYIDVLERSLYNGALDGLSLSGDRFFYDNPLASNGQHQRREWFGTACCPANIARLVTSVGSYIYGKSDDAIWVNLFVGSNTTIPLKTGNVNVKMETNYPWEGDLKLIIDPIKKSKFKVYLRIPGWVQGKTVPGNLYLFNGIGNIPAPIGLTVNGQSVKASEENGYYIIDRVWQKGDKIEYLLGMGINYIEAKEELKQDKSRIAIQRGPIVYCVEGADNKEGIWNLIVPENTEFKAVDFNILDEKLIALQAEVSSASPNKDGTGIEIKKRKITAIPYYCWANRGANSMQVWLPTKITNIKINYQSKYPDGGNYQP